MKADDLRKRGEVIRNLGSIRNDLIAQAKANGQSGINTAREIEMATAGLNENSSAEEISGRALFLVWGEWPAAQLWARRIGWTERWAVIWRRLTRICSARRKVPVWAAGIKRQNLLLSWVEICRARAVR